ncbi:polyprenyl diphosphate synthase [Patescibacteria group bacterium]|nr:polyprenyl diphosphate synthase [Patescibacteria group bacterium]MCL5091380.1 polyprenyl diphosphate synthase [Patescibacteria group bacterium]
MEKSTKGDVRLPVHVAVIPDGNRRWAKKHHLPALVGHQRGYDRANQLAKHARRMGIKILTYWAFSTENWKRAAGEVNHLMGLFERAISLHLREALVDQVRIVHLGRKDRLPPTLKKKISDAEEKTRAFRRHYLAIALDYGGRDEVIRAISKLEKGNLGGRDLEKNGLDRYLDTKDLPQPEPDLIIRTSAQQRTSGFMLWQSQYSEYAFVDKLFPDFTAADFDQCIADYLGRQRRFGA